jgi:hypothetical protein
MTRHGSSKRRSSGLSPETATRVNISATVSRLQWTEDPDAVIAELRAIAGPDHEDWFLEEAGRWAGARSTSEVDMKHSWRLVEAILAIPGTEEAAALGRQRATAPTHRAPRPGIDY